MEVKGGDLVRHHGHSAVVLKPIKSISRAK